MENWEKLRIVLLRILNKPQYRLFGCLIYNFVINLLDTSEMKQKVEAQIEDPKLKAQIDELLANQFTANAGIIDRKPVINVYDCFLRTKQAEEMMFVMIHEILHILNGHSYRGIGLNPTIYNLAADHVINRLIKKDIDDKNLDQTIKFPDDAFYIKELEDDNLSTGEVYAWLLKKTKVTTQTQTIKLPIKGSSQGSNSSNDPGESGENEDNEGESKSPTQQEITIEVKISEVEIDGKKITFIEDLTKSTIEGEAEHKETSEELQSELRTLMNDERMNRGFGSSHIKNHIQKLIEVEIPWDKLLEKAILTKTVPSPDNRSWRRPHKRFYAHGIIMPGIGTTIKVSTAIVLVDTSGSISDTNLQRFGSILTQALGQFDSIRVIKHDYSIHQDDTIKSTEFNTEDVTHTFKGRGGTCHKDPFKAIEKSFLKKEEIAMIIILTDYESNIESIWDKYTWTKYIPVTVCLTKASQLSTVSKRVDPSPIVIKDQTK